MKAVHRLRTLFPIAVEKQIRLRDNRGQNNTHAFGGIVGVCGNVRVDVCAKPRPSRGDASPNLCT
jgi:hypothetical protein